MTTLDPPDSVLTKVYDGPDHKNPVFATGQSVRPEGRTRTDYES